MNLAGFAFNLQKWSCFKTKVQADEGFTCEPISRTIVAWDDDDNDDGGDDDDLENDNGAGILEEIIIKGQPRSEKKSHGKTLMAEIEGDQAPSRRPSPRTASRSLDAWAASFAEVFSSQSVSCGKGVLGWRAKGKGCRNQMLSPRSPWAREKGWAKAFRSTAQRAE